MRQRADNTLTVSRMRCSLRCVWMSCWMSCWRSCWLLAAAGLLASDAVVHTEIQAGPLYRTAGSPLHISCNVSGFNNEDTEKQFEFRVVKPAMPNLEIQIFSTANPGFSYSSHKDRVKSNDISVTRVNPNSVLFNIQRLLKDDEGMYECSVVNLENVYNGIYTAKAAVKVIDGSLSVSLLNSVTSLSRKEGEALGLTCRASTNTIQHTHLAFVWYLRRDGAGEGEGEGEPIISLDRDFTLSPGRAFAQRYQDGLISLDKIGEATYRLKVARLQESDQGEIYCQAQEWIQDPDGSWYKIAQKDTEQVFPLTVEAREVLPDTTSLAVKILAQQTALQEGQELSLSCTVDTQDLEKKFFSLAWFSGDTELARVGPTGILSVGSEYSDREKKGELRATRAGSREYRLVLKPVKMQDQGEYKCRVWPQDQGADGAFTQRKEQDSGSQLITVSASETGLSVTMQDADPTVNEGDRLRLACRVDGVKGQVSVTWRRGSSSIISLSRDGVMAKEAEYASRRARAMRPTSESFVLELDEATPTDSGLYWCDVSEWETSDKIHSQSQSTTVTVTPVESLVKVSLKSRKAWVTVGDNVELMCLVKGPRMPMSLAWTRKSGAGTLSNIVTLNADGAISWSGNQHHYQVKVESHRDAFIYYLQIIGISPREEGLYQCSVSVFLEEVYRRLPPSNQLTVTVQLPGNGGVQEPFWKKTGLFFFFLTNLRLPLLASKLQLSSPPTMTQSINADVQINCSVVSKSSASSLFAVTWLLNRGAANETIVSTDRNGFMTSGPQTGPSSGPSSGQRVSVRRTDGPAFLLTIQRARTSDAGSYVCRVVEWLPDPRGDWFSLPTGSTTTTQLAVTEPANDFLLEKTDPQMTAQEGDQVQHKCNIASGATDGSYFYKVTWLYTPRTSPAIRAPLVELDHTGLLSYPANPELGGLRGRLRLSRPTQRSFCLSIQDVQEEDGGAYQCQVEQHQLSTEGVWQQKATESGNAVTLTVKVADTNLSVAKEEVELNVSKAQDFSVPCRITQQTSSESTFQVTWFWRRSTISTRQPVFTFYRNSTLQTRVWAGELSFGHPLPTLFNLTLSKPGPGNSGLYFCEVEEWLPSPSRGWRKVAVEESGNLTVVVSMQESDAVSGSECLESTLILVLVAVVAVSLVVIVLLLVKLCRRRNSGEKKLNSNLWAEQPLTAKPSAD
ncbi:immunoglobulin superfamily member 3-like [Cololabis saira]|uniref:immunoglobulin superfamily member 3-like n=1 Tax=Cololabis saira TaxID=129043 RepID=UPI002AD3D300|nr:immunoglobulin superfamily member 3-like [Cololabis saira]